MKGGIFHSTLAWVALALLGVVVAVSVSYAASQLSKPSVGLTSEPVPGVSELAPPTRPGRAKERLRTSPTPPATTSAPAPTPTEPDDSGAEDD